MPNLPPAVAREVLHTLRGSLPPPVVDSPEALLARDEAAMAVLAALRPGDALEASLAADIGPAAASPDGAPAPEPAVGTERGVDAITEAEQYAAIYPERAACIRASGGLPQRLDFAPPGAAVVAALIDGTSPILRAIDDRTNRA